MNVIATALEGCYIIEPQVFEDHRGYFFESFSEIKLSKLIPNLPTFIQDNEAFSKEIGVIRGLHAQAGAAAQAKLVRVSSGAVLDVAVDCRKDSPTFGQHVSVELTGSNKKQLLVPRGFLHGYIVLEPNTTFIYKCDNFYNKAAEIGVHVNDATLNINWGIPQSQMILSEKDSILPSFKALAETL